MTIRWDEITLDNSCLLEQVFSIYDQTFPIEVREPHEIFIRSLQYGKKHFRFLVGFEGGQLASFATGHYLASINSGFIVYIATNPTQRSHGVGTQTLLKMEELLNDVAVVAGNRSIDAIFLETEIGHSEQDRLRESFFLKNQYKKLPNKYMQPPLYPGESSVPLHLHMKSLQPNEVKMNEVIQAIYNEKYHVINGIDKEILSNCLREMGIRH